jgi:hypothetical protein
MDRGILSLVHIFLYLVSERKPQFLVSWVEPLNFVGFRASTQPTKINHLEELNLSGRNPTNRFNSFSFRHYSNHCGDSFKSHRITQYAKTGNLEIAVDIFQSNHEGEIVEKIQDAMGKCQGLIASCIFSTISPS